MPKKNGLYQSLIEDNTSHALLITCKYLYYNHIDDLLDEWIAMTSEIGKQEDFDYSELWIKMNNELLDLVRSSTINVSIALLFTTKLFLLYKKVKVVSSDSKKKLINVQKLRSDIIQHFPELANLNVTGKITFRKILPSDPNSDIYKFCIRILAGLSKLLSENKTLELRLALEYLSRKKLVIPINVNIATKSSKNSFSLESLLLSDDHCDIQNDESKNGYWPAPNENEATEGDPSWFLWGALLCFYFNNKKVATHWELYSFHWKKSYKNDRYGLLWGIPFLMQQNTITNWNLNDQEKMDKITSNVINIWKHCIEQFEEEQGNDPKISKIKENLEIFENFVPRITYSQRMNMQYQNKDINFHQKIKHIELNTKNK